jgi:hypothetical protein
MTDSTRGFSRVEKLLVVQPWSEPQDDKERAVKQRALDMIEKLKARIATKAAEEEKTRMD